MPTYISLLRYTQKGIHTIKDGPAQLDDAKEFFQSMGAEVKQYYLVMGKYDAIGIFEAPDDETVAKLALAIGHAGYVQTHTFRAFTEDEYRKIIDALITEGALDDN
jgi:uncharacterized protein with GYD domain